MGVKEAPEEPASEGEGEGEGEGEEETENEFLVEEQEEDAAAEAVAAVEEEEPASEEPPASPAPTACIKTADFSLDTFTSEQDADGMDTLIRFENIGTVDGEVIDL